MLPARRLAAASSTRAAQDVSITGPSLAATSCGYASQMSASETLTTVFCEPKKRADWAAFARSSSGPVRSRPMVNDGSGSPRSWQASASTTVESSPPLR